MSDTTTWITDPTHSEILFKIKHLVISTVTGSFRKFEGKIVTKGNDFNNAKITVNIDVKSIDTNQSQRDEHLQNGDFFAADLYPEIIFDSTSFINTNGVNYKLTGDLTLRGVTKPVELNVEYGGSEKDGYGNLKHGFDITGVINRKEFGMTWNKITDTGGLGLSEDIRLIASIQVAKAAE